MKDPKLEENIKEICKFVEFWTKFHELYKEAIAKNPVPADKTNMFIATKDLVSNRFNDLLDALEIRHGERMTKCLPIFEILSLDDFSTMSDEKLDRLTDHWSDSYFYLYGILNRLKKKKRRIEKFNRFFFVIKKMVTRGGSR